MTDPQAPTVRRRQRPAGRDWVAVTLAVGLATALNLITFAVLADALFWEDSGLSENATQLLTNGFSGIVGVLGTYIGYKAGAAAGHNTGNDSEV